LEKLSIKTSKLDLYSEEEYILMENDTYLDNKNLLSKISEIEIVLSTLITIKKKMI
jgi:hypothetical protein